MAIKMIEIIATTIEDAKRIEKSGCSRIELVSALTEGGLTPSYSLIKNVVQAVNIPINVMIRPHAKSFIYTPEEIQLMKEDILIAKDLKANGVVLGVLNEKNKICEESLSELLSVCDGIDVTFHRAIDELFDPVSGIKVLTKYPQITNVLTSGGKGNIEDNIRVIRDMIYNAGHINVLLGGGLNLQNIAYIMDKAKATDYHFGTAVREDSSAFGEISLEKIKELVEIKNIRELL
ncbi:copper homeostasis protein CutC [Proteiniborus sp. MB09-C3]|uniref:copper homeostasis protein CutC n=1 Tax=Proteiniborus sp. MB09-C3 TaxID=3050072 RepID=UPI0025527A32|nr:copper homeostasis protein CutC [Proteiniborus sp. MB09-C3]WIV13355.1 copper homeostasis protein CutC [Proteiniborus sp. MB09-C3]